MTREEAIGNILKKGWIPIFKSVWPLYLENCAKLDSLFRNEDSFSSFRVNSNKTRSEFLFPRMEDMLNVFSLIGPEEVKVVLLFDKPVTDGSFTGIPLETNNEYYDPLFEIPMHDANVYNDAINGVLEKEYDRERVMPIKTHHSTQYFDVLDWIHQGVLPLTTCWSLQVKDNFEVTYHQDMWESVVSNVIYNLLSRSVNRIVFVSFGLFPSQLVQELINVNAGLRNVHYYINYGTPVSYPLRRQAEFIKNTSFIKINAALESFSESPIKWFRE